MDGTRVVVFASVDASGTRVRADLHCLYVDFTFVPLLALLAIRRDSDGAAYLLMFYDVEWSLMGVISYLSAAVAIGSA